jgi:sulfur carrier protein ThiS adenylyltransferase
MTGVKTAGETAMTQFDTGLLKYLSREDVDTVRSVTVGIAGAGGLGSNCAQFLVRSGFNRFLIADFDRVDPSNLNRQFFFTHQVGMYKVDAIRENLLAVNPGCIVETVNERLEKTEMCRIFEPCHVIVEAFDESRYKTALVELFLTGSMNARWLVAASGIAGWSHPDRIRVRQVRPGLIVVGDMETPADAEHPPLAPKVTMAAAKQADAVLQVVLGRWSDECVA